MTGGLTGGLLRCAAAAVLALLFSVTGGLPAAFAHTQLANSVPASGASLERTPGSIQLSFTEPVDAQLASVVVVGPQGENLAVGAPRQSGSGVMQPVTAAREPGRIRVSYRVISLDGHPVTDSFSFTVLKGDPNAPLAPQGESSPGGTASGGGLGTGLLAGGVAVLALLVGGALVARRRGRPADPAQEPAAPEPAAPGGSPRPSPSQQASHKTSQQASQTSRPRP